MAEGKNSQGKKWPREKMYDETNGRRKNWPMEKKRRKKMTDGEQPKEKTEKKII